MCDLNQLTEQNIAVCLQNNLDNGNEFVASPISTELRRAAVLMPLLQIANQWHLLYIRRAVLPNDRHSGQVAFPGGKYEKQDQNIQYTALREAHEEVGITPEDVNVLGHLGHHHSASSFQITPVVGVMPWPYNLRLQKSEVARTFTIPISWLSDPANHEVRQWKVPEDGREIPIIYFNEYDGELLWGATARMTLSLLQILNSCQEQ